ncbi:MAG: hypothetical protein LBS49_09885 [Candidatus Accumulibacter sp.]|jgi:hypothetical protein|nr:hypothetical protein [Accumulibacter sp.]
MNAASRHSPFWRVWFWPLTLAVSSLAALIAPLVSDQGWAWTLSWSGLSLPVCFTLRFWTLRRWFDR